MATAAILAACGDAPIRSKAAASLKDSARARPVRTVGRPPTPPGHCPYAPVVPTYLPWLKRGEEVPAPASRHTVTEEASYAILDWPNPNWKEDLHSTYYVKLVRTTQYNLTAPGTPVMTHIEGWDAGELHDGKQPGEASVTWVIPNETACSTVSLWFSAPDMTRKQARREATKVAESLRAAE